MKATGIVRKMDKNINAIEKIISELSRKDFEKANIKPNRQYYKKRRPYSLSPETLEAIEVKKAYLTDEISEHDYKSYCLLYNISTFIGNK